MIETPISKTEPIFQEDVKQHLKKHLSTYLSCFWCVWAIAVLVLFKMFFADAIIVRTTMYQAKPYPVYVSDTGSLDGGNIQAAEYIDAPYKPDIIVQAVEQIKQEDSSYAIRMRNQLNYINDQLNVLDADEAEACTTDPNDQVLAAGQISDRLYRYLKKSH